MLDELAVRNLGLIEEAHILPGRGLVVVSGETGTGKTLLLGALRLLLGEEARPDLVGPFGDEAAVEGRFLIEGEEIVARRHIPREGRSRAYLDGSLASGRLLAATLGSHVEIIGQHDQVGFTRPAAVRDLIDGAFDAEGRASLDGFQEAQELVRSLQEARDQLGGNRQALHRELDLVRFQAAEIAGAGFVPGDDGELERRAVRLRHAEALAIHLGAAWEAAGSAQEAWGTALAELRKAARIDPGWEAMVGRLEALGEEMTAHARELRQGAEETVADPAALAAVEERLTALGDLKRKYGPELADVLAFGKSAAEREGELTGLLERAGTIDRELEAAEEALLAATGELAGHRRTTGEAIAAGAVEHLRELGFTDPVVRFEVDDRGRVQLLFSSDARLPPGDVARIASGGELSRLVLALRLAAGSQRPGTDSAVLVFDEIDAGIGGAVSLALGRKLGWLAADQQVFCVTHLPQVAAFADTHLVVERSDNRATVGVVEGAPRIAEIARMLAGLPESERGREAAAELVELAVETRARIR
jgi:DNA repair protein RecN (Recombination protein N)